MPLLQHLPQLEHVGIKGSFDVYLNDIVYMFWITAHLARFPCMDDELNLFARYDPMECPEDPFHCDFMSMDRQETTEALR